MAVAKLILVAITLNLVIASEFQTSGWNVTFSPSKLSVLVGETKTIEFNLTGTSDAINLKPILLIEGGNSNLIDVYFQKIITHDFFTGKFNISGIFLGKTELRIKIINPISNRSLWETSESIRILRPQRLVDKLFTISVAVLVSLIYINFGCALNWTEFNNTLRKPTGPIITFCSQFIFMPVASYVLGLLLFGDNIDMRLGMFFTGIAPGGGASNMWTLLLGGNVPLSIMMTTISNVAAFAMMPLWVFTLGRYIFDKGDIPVPYSQISTYAIALVVPLLIGYLLQRYLKSFADVLAKSLKGFAAALLVFIIAFAVFVNYYIFRLFSWQLCIAGLALPWLGYAFAYLLSRFICRQTGKDSLTIAIETGIQNTGIAIFLLRFTLPQPEADITTIVPVSVATMTPIPLVLLYVIQKLRERSSSRGLINNKDNEEQSTYQTMIN